MYGTIIHYRFYQRFYRLICFRHPEGCSGRRAIDCFKIWIRLSAVEGEIIETHDRWIAGGKQQIWIWGVLINKTVLVWDFRYDDFQLLSYLSRSIRQVRASRWDQMSHQPCKSPKKIVVSPGHHRPRSQRQKIPQMQLKWPGPGMRRSQIFFFGGGVGESICKSGFFCIFYWEYHTISFWGVLWNKDKEFIEIGSVAEVSPSISSMFESRSASMRCRLHRRVRGLSCCRRLWKTTLQMAQLDGDHWRDHQMEVS